MNGGQNRDQKFSGRESDYTKRVQTQKYFEMYTTQCVPHSIFNWTAQLKMISSDCQKNTSRRYRFSHFHLKPFIQKNFNSRDEIEKN